MSRLTRLATALVPAAMLFIGSNAMADAPFHVGIVTGTVSQSEDDLRGAEAAHQGIRLRQDRRHDPASDLP